MQGASTRLGSEPGGSLQPDQDPRSFINLKHDWTYRGGFCIEFAGSMWDHAVPASVSVCGTGFRVQGGVVRSPYGKDEIEMEDAQGCKFTWPVECARHIRNWHGQLLWVNPKLHPQAET